MQGSWQPGRILDLLTNCESYAQHVKTDSGERTGCCRMPVCTDFRLELGMQGNRTSDVVVTFLEGRRSVRAVRV
jgi:hypothetical protein